MSFVQEKMSAACVLGLCCALVCATSCSASSVVRDKPDVGDSQSGGASAVGGAPGSGGGGISVRGGISLGGSASIAVGGGTPISGQLVVTAGSDSVNVDYGTQTPTVAYSCSLNGKSVGCSYTTDRGQIANVDGNGTLTPTAMVGGTVTVTATYQNLTASASLVVNLEYTENGASGPQPDAGIGGPGGVGGEGLGAPVTASTQAVLDGTPTADSGLAWLYPYDKTVWPRGLLAPLLQWSAPRNYDAVLIDLKEAALSTKDISPRRQPRSSTIQFPRPLGMLWATPMRENP